MPQVSIDDLKFCNCAECGVELLGDSFRTWWVRLPDDLRSGIADPVAGRIMGRPYCARCLSLSRHEPGGHNAPADDHTAWQENAERAWEEADAKEE